MTSMHVQVDVLRDQIVLRDRLREVGILLVGCDLAGELRARPPRGGDWLSDLFCYSPLFRRELRRAVDRWNGEPVAAPLCPFAGLWLVPMPVQARRGRSGYAVAIILDDAVLEVEQLEAMCQGAMLDLTLVRSLVSKLPPAAARDVPRLAEMVRHAHDDHHRMRVESAAMESVGSQLAESYEEINLLYTITGNMGVVQEPERFVAEACEELLETLTYRWIATRFRREERLLRRLGGWSYVTGEPPGPRPEIDRLLGLLLERSRADAPAVLEPEANESDHLFRALGRVVLVHPVSRDGQLLGILVAGEKDGTDLEASSGDMKLLGATASHMAIFLENAALYEDLNDTFLGTVEALTSAIDAKDRYTCGHSRRVAHLTEQLARAAGLDARTGERYRIAGLVHDVGKIGVPERVLTKPGRLDEDEFAWIRKHPEIGHRILRDIPRLEDILPGVLYHHERWDGGGYPAGLQGEEIPRIARMLALADSFDAMSSTRTYRAALSRTEVIAEIQRNRGRQFDPDLVPEFIQLDFGEFDRLVEEHRATDDAVQGGAAA